MKKVLISLVAAIAVITVGLVSTAKAETKFRASVSPQFGYVTKLNVPAGTYVRKANFVLDADASVELWKGLGIGMDFAYMPGAFSPVVGTSGDIDVYGLTFGPRYYFPISTNWELFGFVNFGWYRTDASATVAAVKLSTSEDAWGMNGGVGINYVYKKLTVGLKGGTHYIKNIGGNEDMMVWTVGPTIGVKF